MSRSVVAVILTLSAMLVLQAPGMVLAASGDEGVKATGPAPAVATEQKAATVRLEDADKGGAALEVTARPLKGAAASPPYLVGVYDQSGPGAAPKLLGSFSFYPARAGEAQKFVIPRPQPEAPQGKDVTLSIKLIPAHPAADIKGAAVEILGARVLD